jgi:hypothetical protein
MSAEKQMVPGFNHNVKHKGTPYHVQTEDSGVDNPRIITHLFVGGNVIASKKTSYADIVGAENLAQVVRELMEEQHKEMLRNLISGVYDDTNEDVAAKSRAFQPGQIASQPERSTVAWPPPAPAAEQAPAPRPQEATAKPAESPKPAAPTRAPAARPPPIRRPVPGVAGQTAPSAAKPARGLPATAGAPPTAAAAALRADPAAGAQRPAPAGAAPAAASSPERREKVDALFGEDLISEKSLDEVILSYLAEDLAEKT